MRVQSIEGNTQRLDGGAMFGNCPRALWSRWCPPDPQHRIPLACRSMLVREGSGRNILFEAGIGVFFEPKLRDRFGVQESHHVLLESLAAEGLSPGDIDVIVLSHLHFDHAGGLLSSWEQDASPRLVFPEAQVVVSQRAWDRSQDPHPRDRASFIPELGPLLEATGRLEIVPGDRSDVLGDGYTFTYSEGHTPGLMLTRVALGETAIHFMGDLVPGVPWVHLPITMGYDRYPELLIDEKRGLLTRLADNKEWAFYTHDAQFAASKVLLDDRGRYVPEQQVTTVDLTD